MRCYRPAVYLDRRARSRTSWRIGQAADLLDVGTAVGSTVLAMWRGPGTLQKLRPLRTLSPFADTVEVVVQTSAGVQLCVELHAVRDGEAYINAFPMHAAAALALWEATQ